MIGLEYIRKVFGDTTTSLAEKLEISNVNISNWENCKKPIPENRLKQLYSLYSYIPKVYFTKELTRFEQLDVERIKICLDIRNSSREEQVIIKTDNNGTPIEFDTIPVYGDRNLTERLRDIESDMQVEKVVEEVRSIVGNSYSEHREISSYMEYIDNKETDINLIYKFISLMKYNDAMFLAYILRAVELSNDDSWGENPKLDRNGLTGRVLKVIAEWKEEEKKRQEAEYQEYKELFGLDDESEE